MADIEIRGLDQLIKKLGNIATMKPKLEQATKKAIFYVHSQVPSYPPPPNNRYTRTVTLGRSVTTFSGSAPGALSRVEDIGGNVNGIIGTNVEYAPFVIGEGTQASVHRGRWWTLQGVVQKAKDGIVKVYENMVKDMLK